MHSELQYLLALEKILQEGIKTPSRTGINCYVYPHIILSFDFKEGFPLFTHKKMAVHTFKVELEGFIKGITDKKWYQERKCHIWDEWCNPQKVPYAHDEETKKKMFFENDLGKIYGYQWRNFNSSGYDQLQKIIQELKTNPYNRQLVCSAWNPLELHEQALPPCHVLWHVFVTSDQRMHLSWFQRSADFPLGVPANVMSYALLLHLLCKETGYKEGIVTGFFSNCHIYENQVEGVLEAITRPIFPFPSVKTENFTSIFDWKAEDTVFENYKCGEKIIFPIAV
ncbi:MAG: thymidylate synthase [Candidatus Dojkabacteria bacterium]|nr:thymidylate synthase [Candidatus Dojkabacteria bacterium]